MKIISIQIMSQAGVWVVSVHYGGAAYPSQFRFPSMLTAAEFVVALAKSKDAVND